MHVSFILSLEDHSYSRYIHKQRNFYLCLVCWPSGVDSRGKEKGGGEVGEEGGNQGVGGIKVQERSFWMVEKYKFIKKDTYTWEKVGVALLLK